MFVTDKNFSIILDFNKSTTASSCSEYLWALGDQLEDMPVLFKIARVFSCFLQCFCLEGWYLDTILEELRECIKKKVVHEVIGIEPSLNQYPFFSDARHVLTPETIKTTIFHLKNLVDHYQKNIGEANQLLQNGMNPQVVSDALWKVGCDLKDTIRCLEIRRIETVLYTEFCDPSLVREACKMCEQVAVINLEKEIRSKLHNLQESFKVWQAQVERDEIELLTSGVNRESVMGTAKKLRPSGEAFIKGDTLAKQVRPLEIARIKQLLITNGDQRDLVDLASHIDDQTSVIDLEKAIRQKRQTILDEVVPNNKQVWSEKMKDLPNQYRENFTRNFKFAHIFSGFTPYSDELFRPMVKEYNDRILNQLGSDVTKEAESLIANLIGDSGHQKVIFHNNQVMEEAVFIWKNKADPFVILSPENIHKEVRVVYMQILRDAPKKQEEFNEFLLKQNDQKLIQNFPMFLRHGTWNSVIDKSVYGFSNRHYEEVLNRYKSWKHKSH